MGEGEHYIENKETEMAHGVARGQREGAFPLEKMVRSMVSKQKGGSK